MPVIDLSGLQTALGAPEPILSGYVKVTYWAEPRRHGDVSAL